MNDRQTGNGKTKEAAQAFHLEEWRSLRDEVATLVKDTRDLERNALLACFAIWVWVLSRGDLKLWPALLLPVIAAALGAWRAKALGKQIIVIGEYLRRIEDAYGFGGELGWERFFRGDDPRNARAYAVGRTANWFWGILIGGSVLISAIIGTVFLKTTSARSDRIEYSIQSGK